MTEQLRAPGIQAVRRQPWAIAVLGMFVVAVVNGITTSGITTFDEAILNELGGSRSSLKVRETINFWGAALVLPFVGFLIDRFGARLASLVGLALLSAAIFAYGHINSIGQIYALHGVFAIAIGLTGSLAMIVLVTRLFSARRGTALGITLAGTSLGAAIMGQVGPWLSQLLGWREAFGWLAIAPLVLLVAVFVLVPKTGTSEATVSAQDKANSHKLGEALHSPSFWMLVVTGFLTFGCILAVFQNIFLHMRDLGYPPATAGLALSVLAICSLTGKIIGGALGDMIGPARLLRIMIVLMGAGALGLASLNAMAVWPSLLLIGLGWGAIHTLINALTIAVFGVAAAGRINGVISIFEALGAGIGPLAAALVFDFTGSYAAAFLSIAVAMVASLAAVWFVRISGPSAPV